MTSGFTRFHEIEKTLKIQAFLILGNSRFHEKKAKFEIIRGFFVDFLVVDSVDFIKDRNGALFFARV